MSTNGQHLRMLDGWRGISISLVLLAHLFPIGPKNWHLNEAFGASGMAIFFTLSGFLITRLLLADQNVPAFLVKRLMRIVPLAWVVIACVMLFSSSSIYTVLAHIFFYANLPPILLINGTGHFWSLCVEVQFYLGIALLIAFSGKKGLYVLPFICVVITIYRFSVSAYIDIVTIRRIDEILAGCTLALVFSNILGINAINILKKMNPIIFIGLLGIASHPNGFWMNYFRPYIAAILVGSTLYKIDGRLHDILCSKVLFYLAQISYALYVIHGVLIDTWLGQGDRFHKYLKRPLLIAITFIASHISTHFFEAFFIKWGKMLAVRFQNERSV